MKKYKTQNIIIEPEDDNYLASVYFDFGNHKYLTVCRNLEEDEDVYIEKNEQTHSGYSNKINYQIQTNYVKFVIPSDLAIILNCPTEFEVEFNINQEKFNQLGSTLKNIFEK